MAGRSRRGKPQTTEEEEDEGQQQEQMVSLKFRDTLTWRPGKQPSAHNLNSKLERLSQELMDLEQELTDKNSLLKVAKELASSNLLQHKDKGVKALTAACLADILRICAPDAPFTESQLRDIFALFIRHIIPALHDPSASYHTQHKYVLASLTEVQSILLLNEIEQADDLMVQLFSTLFDTVTAASKSSASGLASGDLEFQSTELLYLLVDESHALPTKVIDVIMAQFLRAAPSQREKGESASDQATLELKEVPPAYSMAAAICNRAVDKMLRYVGHYFSDVVYEASGIAGSKSNGHKAHKDDEDGTVIGPSEDDIRELRKAHRLVRELWRAAPAVVANIIPQLEQELNADNPQIRQLATETIGDMISGIGAAGPPLPPPLEPLQYPPLKMIDEVSSPHLSVLMRPIAQQAFIQSHGTAFRSFMMRRNDKSAMIRAVWTTGIGFILSTRAGGTGLGSHDQADMVKYLGEKLNDVDEKVRLAAIKAIESFDFQDIILVLGAAGGVDTKNSLLCNLADRARDKRPPVRVEATILLAKLWAVGAGEIEAGEDAVTAALGDVPSRLFNAYYANDKELNVLLDRAVFEHLVPLGFPPVSSKAKTRQANSGTTLSILDQDRVRAERILLLVRSLDTNAKKALFAMHSRQPQFSKVMASWVSVCEQFNGSIIEDKANEKKIKENLTSSSKYLASFQPDADKASMDLVKFAKFHDRRNYQLIRYAISIESDFKTAHRAIKELMKRLQDKPQLLQTLLPLLYRSSCLIFNRSYLSTFMDHSRNDTDFGSTAHEILNEISSRNPDLFKTHAGALRKELEENAPNEKDEAEPNPGVVESLKAYSSYSQKYPGDIPRDRKFMQALVKHALYGPTKSAKLAVKIMLANKDDKSLANATALLQKVMVNWEYGASCFLNGMVIVAQLEALAPQVAMDEEKRILDMTITQILLDTKTMAKADDPEFVTDLDQADIEIQAKVLALKINVNRLLGIANLEEAREKGDAVFKLLRPLLKHGELSKDATAKPTPKHHKAYLRLAAAQMYLKLCTNPTYDDIVRPVDFNLIAYTLQDPQPSVRRGFAERLQKYLTLGKLKHRFYTPIFLAAYEPQKELKTSIETWIRSRVRHFQHKKLPVLESIMGRLISLLAHHPDFVPQQQELLDHARYLIFYVQLVATQDNIGMIYRYAERVKQTKDAIDPVKSEHIYIICDLAMAVVRKWQEKNNWIFQAFSGKIGLPKGLYAGLSGHSAAQEVAEKQFIPDGIEDKLDDLLSKKSKKKRKPFDELVGYPAAKKAKVLAADEKPVKKALKKMKSTSKKAKNAPSWELATAITDSERRRSGRVRHAETSYAERDSSEDEAEMLEGVAKWKYDNRGEIDSNSTDSSEVESEEDDVMDEDKTDSNEDEEMKDDNGKEAEKLVPRKLSALMRRKAAAFKNDNSESNLREGLGDSDISDTETGTKRASESAPGPKTRQRTLPSRGRRSVLVAKEEKEKEHESDSDLSSILGDEITPVDKVSEKAVEKENFKSSTGGGKKGSFRTAAPPPPAAHTTRIGRTTRSSRR